MNLQIISVDIVDYITSLPCFTGIGLSLRLFKLKFIQLFFLFFKVISHVGLFSLAGQKFSFF